MMDFERWLNITPVWLVGLYLIAAILLAAFIGQRARKRLKTRPQDAPEDEAEDGDGGGFVISAMLGLLALLVGFTFSLAVDRYDSRRVLVLDEANAIGTSYLRAQLLEEPHRSRMSQILHDYAENRVALGQASAWDNRKALMEKSDRLITDLWSATAAGFDSVRELDFSTGLLEPVNAVIDFDTSRKTARFARVPPAVFLVLFIYVVATAAMLGYKLHTGRSFAHSAFFLALMAMSLLLIVDIDGPTTGWVRESQMPMVLLRDSLRQTPPGTYDRWRTNPPQVPKEAPPAPAR